MNNYNLKYFFHTLFMLLIATFINTITMYFTFTYNAFNSTPSSALFFYLIVGSAVVIGSTISYRNINNEKEFGTVLLHFCFLVSGIMMLLNTAAWSFSAYNDNGATFVRLLLILLGIIVGSFHPNVFIKIFAFTYVLSITYTMPYLKPESSVLAFFTSDMSIPLYSAFFTALFLFFSFNNNALRFYPLIAAFGVYFLCFYSTIGILSAVSFSDFRFSFFSHNPIDFAVIFAGMIPFLVKADKKSRLAVLFSLPFFFAVFIYLPNGVFFSLLIFSAALYLQNRTLYIFSVILFAVSLFTFYYGLDTTLIKKSVILIISGLICIAAGTLLNSLYKKTGERYV